MKKLLLSSICLIFLLTVITLPTPVLGAAGCVDDSRYADNFECTSHLEGDPENGTWDYFEPDFPHGFDWYEWQNDFAAIIDYDIGHVSFWLTLRPWSSMAPESPYTSTSLEQKIWLNDESDHVGFRVRWEFEYADEQCEVKLYDLDGTFLDFKYYYGWTEYDIFEIVIRFKANVDAGGGDAYWDVEVAENIDNVVTSLYNYTHDDGENIDSLAIVHHYVAGTYDDTYARWTAHADYGLGCVGIRPDTMYADAEVDMYDVVQVTSHYNDNIGDEYTLLEWFRDTATNVWKSDIIADGKIDIFDVAYITSKYGQEY